MARDKERASVSSLPKGDALLGYHELQTPRQGKKGGLGNPSPLDTAPWLSYVTQWWLRPLLTRGFATPLQESDVWDLPREDQVRNLQAKFQAHWSQIPEDQQDSPYRFLRALWRTTWPAMRVSIGLQLLSAALTVLQPLIIKSLVQFLQNESNMFGIESGYALALFLAASSFVNVSALDTGTFISTHSGCTSRMLLISSVYNKLLRLSATARRSMNTGEAVTLVGVDSERVMDVYSIGGWMVTAPLILLAVAIVTATQTDTYVGLFTALAMVCIMVLSLRTSRSVGRYRHRIAAISGERVQVTNEVLQGIRVIKLYGWETAMGDKIKAIRHQEINLMLRYNQLRLLNGVLMFLAPTLLNVVAFTTYVLQGNSLDVATVFVVLALTSACKVPFTVFANVSVYGAEAVASTKRVSAFLNAEEITDLPQPAGRADEPVLSLTDADFQWTHESLKPTLSNINLRIIPKSLTIIVGSVGSGKSSLMNAILGEMLQTRGSRDVSGSIAYASQQAWIQNQALRENILFGEAYDSAHYRRVIAACQLLPDFAMLEDGDATEIGERGINLSGGQKARVSIARALYHARHANFLLMDDPLSALDVHVANAVFDHGLNGLAGDATRLLVLNSHYHLLQYADRVLVLESGQIVGDGTLTSLQNEFPFLVASHGNETSPRDVSADSMVKVGHVNDNESVASSSAVGETKQLVETEDRSMGSVSVKTYVQYLGSCGWNGYLVAGIIAVLFAVAQGVLFMCDWFVSHWSKGAFNLSQHSALGVYVGIVALAVALVALRSIVYMATCMRCSENLHGTYLGKVLLAPVTTFFDVTPIGRILNRFSRDLDQVDSPLPYFSMWMLIFLFQVTSIFLVCAVTSPYVLIVYAPLVLVFLEGTKLYQRSARELKRIDSITRTPFLSLVSETGSGLETIRSFRASERFALKSEQLLDHNAKFFFAFQSSTRWFAIRADWLMALVIACVAMLIVATRHHLGPVAAGLALTYASQLSSSFQRTMQLITQTESIMTCFERIAHYDSLETEGSATKPAQLPVDWPRTGQVAFENVTMRYRSDLDLVLKGVSFSIASGEKVGVCGRTGSGKSSLMSVLFRVVECTSGRVLIDGVDIASITVHQLRSKMTIIPQDPVLFSGTVRRNLDPFDEKTDAELWTVLKKVHLADTVSAWGHGLEYQVTEKGDNLSIGQRQLICIARALVRESKIVVMDEATANVDQTSDKLIQLTVRESFGCHDTTVLSIAHRLETILDSDKILVLDAGHVAQFGSPRDLIQQDDSIFRSLVDASK